MIDQPQPQPILELRVPDNPKRAWMWSLYRPQQVKTWLVWQFPTEVYIEGITPTDKIIATGGLRPTPTAMDELCQRWLELRGHTVLPPGEQLVFVLPCECGCGTTHLSGLCFPHKIIDRPGVLSDERGDPEESDLILATTDSRPPDWAN